ncbi:MAG: hypothetical protein M1281_12710 [Chloroflexi bacterium]|nr:hypothetical protein [Chloroflexota bacterium]
MKQHSIFVRALSLASIFVLLTAGLAAASITEIDPNDSPDTANPLAPRAVMYGAVDPKYDQDYFALQGLITSWGFIALLDTSDSSPIQVGVLSAYGSDGTTLLQSDEGSWEKGSGIALQKYADGDDMHYLSVAAPLDQTISSYHLRYYQTIVKGQPEVEPNNDPAHGTPSSFTHNGVIDPPGDVDCYDFQGRAGDTILLALKNNGSALDPILKLISPTGGLLKESNWTRVGGNEFLESAPLPEAGVYAYCVSAGAGEGGPTETYQVGLVRNGGLYYPDHSSGVSWLESRPGSDTKVGDILTFKLWVSNDSPLDIPDKIEISADYPAGCLELVSADPPLTEAYTVPGRVSWVGQKTGLIPGEKYAVTVQMRALAPCQDRLRGGFSLPYYFTGWGGSAEFTIYEGHLYLPFVQRVN